MHYRQLKVWECFRYDSYQQSKCFASMADWGCLRGRAEKIKRAQAVCGGAVARRKLGYIYSTSPCFDHWKDTLESTYISHLYTYIYTHILSTIEASNRALSQHPICQCFGSNVRPHNTWKLLKTRVQFVKGNIKSISFESSVQHTTLWHLTELQPCQE